MFVWNTFSLSMSSGSNAHNIVFHSEIVYIISEYGISLTMLLFSIKLGRREFTFCPSIFVSNLLARKDQ